MNTVTTGKSTGDFLNAKSMLTPGIAGGTTMLITNCLASNFSLPPNYTGLIVSLLFGLMVFAATAAEKWWLRGVLYILNSLIIFSVALGANQAGVAKTHQTAPTTFTQYSQMIKSAKTGAFDAPFFSNWLDGTVPRRKELVTSVQQLSEPEVRNVLSKLGAKPEGDITARATLESKATSSRTVEQVNLIKDAVKEAKESIPSTKGSG